MPTKRPMMAQTNVFSRMYRLCFVVFDVSFHVYISL